MNEKLTTKQRLFVEAYLVTSNATESARRAGYKGDDKQLGIIGHQNLGKLSISKLVQERVETAIINANEILTDVKNIAKNADEKTSDRLKAYEMLGKNLAMWIEKTEHSGKSTVEIEYVNDWRG